MSPDSGVEFHRASRDCIGLGRSTMPIRLQMSIVVLYRRSYMRLRQPRPAADKHGRHDGLEILPTFGMAKSSSIAIASVTMPLVFQPFRGLPIGEPTCFFIYIDS